VSVSCICATGGWDYENLIIFVLNSWSAAVPTTWGGHLCVTVSPTSDRALGCRKWCYQIFCVVISISELLEIFGKTHSESSFPDSSNQTSCSSLGLSWDDQLLLKDTFLKNSWGAFRCQTWAKISLIIFCGFNNNCTTQDRLMVTVTGHENS
jgi:hypothetical protein